MIEGRYLAAFTAATLLWCSLFLAFTSIIDPYGVSPIQLSLERINKYKPKRFEIDRLIKPYEVWRYKPRTVFLGTSRIHQGIDPSVLEGTTYAPGYNASIPASTLGMNISHLRQYIDLNPELRTVVVELFVYNFLREHRRHVLLREDQQRHRGALTEYLQNTAKLFFSGDALGASAQTLWHNWTKNVPVREITRAGFFYYPPGHRAKGTFDAFAAGIWKLHAARLQGMTLYEPVFDSFRELIAIGREHRLNLIFIVTPNHAYDDYYIDAIGAWNTVSDWLLRLSSETVIYSFSQPNSWMHEPVRTHMLYWNDPYHFSLEMGRAMQAALIGLNGIQMPDNFMVRLTPDKVPAHIDERRKAIRRWAAQNPDFVAKFEEERRKWEASYATKNN